MVEKVLNYIQTHTLFNPEQDRLLAAVSGGMDSVVLCDVLAKLKCSFAVVHCNFGLRGEESDADELFVKKLAKKYEVPFFVEHFNTQEYADQEGISIQMAARLLRYNWFEKVRKEENYDYVATAHHTNDTAETILLNLTRGTGLAGLHGIPPKNGHVVRPLLALNKDDIFDYLTHQRLAWREDSSNENTKYQRNLIRHEVLPVLKQINPNLEITMQQSAEKIMNAELIYHAYMEQMRKHVVKEEPEAVYLSINELKKATALPLVLLELLKPFHFNYTVVKEIIEAFEGIPGKTFESATHVLVKDREQLVLTPKNLAPFRSMELQPGQETVQTEHFRLTFQEKDGNGYRIPIDNSVAALDLGLLKYPLKLRKWKEGDWFVPLGMNGKKKISDFLIDAKIPANLKQHVMVLTSGSSIVWIVGHRLDNRFKITDQTEKVLEVRYEAL